MLKWGWIYVTMMKKAWEVIRLTYGVLSKYRSFLMGFAILWVMYFHIPMNFVTEVGWFIHRIGFYGVDIFLFLSGLGVYYSLTKRPNVLRFYGARIARILPAYIIVACVSYCLLRLDKASALDFFYYISGVGYWTRHTRFDWYIPTQLAFYLITPLFLFFYKKLSGKKQIIYVAICMSLSVPLCFIMYHNDLVYLWGAAVRLSVFLLGIHMGRLAAQDKKVTKTSLILNIVAFTVGTFLAYYLNGCVKEPEYIKNGLNCYPALLMMPSFCLLISLGLSVLNKKLPKLEKVIVYPLGFLGKYSLELYLLHQRLQSIIPKYFEIENQWIILLVTLVISLLLGMAIKCVRVAVKKHKKRKKAV